MLFELSVIWPFLILARPVLGFEPSFSAILLNVYYATTPLAELPGPFSENSEGYSSVSMIERKIWRKTHGTLASEKEGG